MRALLARHMGRHIPGQPNVVPKNMPGAGSFLAVNNVYGVAPKDGTVLAIGAPTIALDERLGTAECALQDRRARLGRPRQFAHQHRVHVAHVEGEDLRRRA